MPGQIFVISGPPGAGKSSIAKMLLAKVDNLVYSVSLTTRAPRPGETHGVEYFFVSREDFQARLDSGEMLEHVEVFGNLYGTSGKELNSQLEAGRDVLLDIEVIGVSRVRRFMPRGIFIFLLPPSRRELERRLKLRATESPEMIQNRLERLDYELSQIEPYYDYLVINQELDKAYAQIEGIVLSQRLSVRRLWPQVRPLWLEHGR